MKYGYLPSGNGGHFVIASEHGTAWTGIAIAFTAEAAELIVKALTEQSAIDQFRDEIDQTATERTEQ